MRIIRKSDSFGIDLKVNNSGHRLWSHSDQLVDGFADRLRSSEWLHVDSNQIEYITGRAFR